MNRTSWARSISLDQRLFAIFTATFLLGLVILALFLGMSAHAIELNAVADKEHQAAREIFALKQALSRMEIAHNQFEITSAPADLIAFHSMASRLGGLLVETKTSSLNKEDKQTLEEFDKNLDKYIAIFDKIEEAILAGKYDQVAALDEQAYTIIPDLFKRLDEVIERSSSRVDDIDREISAFQLVVSAGVILGLLLFVWLAMAALLLIHRQINTPLGQLSQAVAAIETGRFDPASIQHLAERQDEIGAIAGELVSAAGRLSEHQVELKRQAEETRRKIR